MDLLSLTISTLFFLGGFASSVWKVRSGTYHHGYTNLVLIGAGFIFQCFFLYSRGQLHGRCPITSGAEILVFIAWSLAIMYFILGRAFRLSLVGAFTAPILVILHLPALIITLFNPAEPNPTDSMDPWLEMHAAMSLLAYGAFALAAVSGLMYLIQNRQLKSGSPGLLSFNLPPIRYLAAALLRLIIIGLLLLTVGVISAFFMRTAPSRLHLSVSGGVWFVYTAVLIYHLVKRPPAHWLSMASLIAFGFALITLSVI